MSPDSFPACVCVNSRTAKGMTQQQLAVAAGLSMSLVSQIEQGTNADHAIRSLTVRALARALAVKLADLTENGETSGADQASKPPRALPAPPPVSGDLEQSRPGNWRQEARLH